MPRRPPMIAPEAHPIQETAHRRSDPTKHRRGSLLRLLLRNQSASCGSCGEQQPSPRVPTRRRKSIWRFGRPLSYAGVPLLGGRSPSSAACRIG
jgi:hypothetical protein